MFIDYLNEMEPNNYTQNKYLICDWTDKKKYLIRNRMLKCFDGHGITVDKVNEIVSFKQSKCLKNSIKFITQKKSSIEWFWKGLP